MPIKKSMTIEQAIDLPIREVERLSENEKSEYFGLLREYCRCLGEKYSQEITATQRFIARHGKRFRSFPLKVIGKENMPKGRLPGNV